ncbi:tetratricopeptide repeat protein, partial [candidate division KSB1 bacterium]|nr:tetratricopeptide repeat protein [candidate division KSB1 bacterium]
KELERFFEQVPLSPWQEALLSLRRQVLSNFEEDGELQTFLLLNDPLNKLCSDYSGEVDLVVTLYDRLENLEENAHSYGSQKMLWEIAAQKKSVLAILDDPQLAQSASQVDEYMQEVVSIAAILDQLSELQVTAREQNLEVSVQIEQLQRSIVANLDKRVLALIGYDSFAAEHNTTIAEFFQAWKALQYAEYSRDLTAYQIIKTSLLMTGSFAARERMLERDFEDALVNYSDGDTKLAGIQLSTILNDYSKYSENLDSVHFYRAESYFARLLYEQAGKDYVVIVRNFPDTDHLGDSLFRLMQISEKNGQIAAVFNYYNLFKSRPVVDQELAGDCHYLAGTVYLNDSKFEEAEEALSNIPQDSRHYWKGRYLSAIILVNQEDYTAAIPAFQELADQAPADIKNNSYLKLGYLAYEKGHYVEALSYFKQVSPGFENFDQGLLASAWASFKQKNYDQTVAYIHQLAVNHIGSNARYEALMLSAHNKKLLNWEEPAERELRYVSSSGRASKLSERYHAERDLVVSQLNDLDRMEDVVIEQKDKVMYNFISQLRSQLKNALLGFEYHGTTGSVVYDELQNERKEILNQIDELEQVISEAHTNGNKKVAERAAKQRARLIRVLEVYKPESVAKVNYLSDYPLATKEGTANYQNRVLSKLMNESAHEGRKIQQTLQAARLLQDKTASGADQLSAETDLAILENELSDLAVETSQLQVWLVENQVETIETDFDRLADFSGFGLSNLTFSAIDDRDSTISDLSFNISRINSLMQERSAEIEQKKLQYEKELQKLEKERHQEGLNLKKQDRKKYFEELYFNRDEKEIEEKQEKKTEAETQEKTEKKSPGKGTGQGSHAENGNEKGED